MEGLFFFFLLKLYCNEYCHLLGSGSWTWYHWVLIARFRPAADTGVTSVIQRGCDQSFLVPWPLRESGQVLGPEERGFLARQPPRRRSVP